MVVVDRMGMLEPGENKKPASSNRVGPPVFSKPADGPIPIVPGPFPA
jgi:hypothetical protein